MILGIYGSGGLGREMAQVAEETNEEEGRWGELVFIDDVESLAEKNGLRVMGFDQFTKRFSPDDAECVVAIGEPAARVKLARRIEEAGFRLASFVHPTAVVHKTSSIGRGTVLFRGARLSPNVRIGNNVTLNFNLNIGHDCVVGDNCLISTFVAIGGGTVVRDNVFIGMGAVIRDHVLVGSNSVVSMGSHVFKDVPEGVTVMGSPARPLRLSGEGVFH